MFRQSNQYAAPVLEPLLRAGFSQRPDIPAEKPGILPHTGSIYAILKTLELTLVALKKKT